MVKYISEMEQKSISTITLIMNEDCWANIHFVFQKWRVHWCWPILTMEQRNNADKYMIKTIQLGELRKVLTLLNFWGKLRLSMFCKLFSWDFRFFLLIKGEYSSLATIAKVEYDTTAELTIAELICKGLVYEFDSVSPTGQSNSCSQTQEGSRTFNWETPEIWTYN